MVDEIGWQVPFPPRSALRPLGLQRGYEGLTSWEFIAWSSLSRYKAGDRARLREHLEWDEWAEKTQAAEGDDREVLQDRLEEENWEEWWALKQAAQESEDLDNGDFSD